MVLKKPSERGVAQALLLGVDDEIKFVAQGFVQQAARLAEQVLIVLAAMMGRKPNAS
jgi:hypothetical protein